MTNREPIQSEFDFWEKKLMSNNWFELVPQEVLGEVRKIEWKVKVIVDMQWALEFSLVHLLGWLLNKWEYYWCTYFKLKNKNYSYKWEWKIVLEWFWINESKNIRYFIVKIWWKNFKINLGDYKFSNGVKKVNDWTVEWFEVKRISLEEFKINSIQKGVWKWFSEIKPTKYFSYLIWENWITTTMNFSDYIKTVSQEFLKDLLKQL